MTAGRVRAWLELARITNLPTVWSNVLVGVALGVGPAIGAGALPWGPALGVGVIASALYIAGMMLNDVVDTRFDAAHRAERPIPSGRVRRGTALAVVIVLIVGALAGAAMISPVALLLAGLLAASIVAYDVLHKRFPLAIILMGVCRALVYPLATAAVAVTPVAPGRVRLAASIVVGLYTVALTVGASQEHHARGIRGVGWLMIALVVTPLIIVRPTAPTTWMATTIAGVVLVLWLARSARLIRTQPPRVIDAVLGWLAGFCLLDAWLLTLMDTWTLALAAGVCFVITVLAHRRILGT